MKHPRNGTQLYNKKLTWLWEFCASWHTRVTKSFKVSFCWPSYLIPCWAVKTMWLIPVNDTTWSLLYEIKVQNAARSQNKEQPAKWGALDFTAHVAIGKIKESWISHEGSSASVRLLLNLEYKQYHTLWIWRPSFDQMYTADLRKQTYPSSKHTVKDTKNKQTISKICQNCECSSLNKLIFLALTTTHATYSAAPP